MKRIVTQAEMQEVCSQTSFCYLCGSKLCQRGRSISREHIIPKALRGPAPDLSADAWSPILPVHTDCDDRAKSKIDSKLNAVQRINIMPGDQWKKRDVNETLPFVREALTSSIGPIMTQMGDVIQGAFTWVQGLHSSLYGLPLSRNKWVQVVPPVPSMCRNTNGEITVGVDQIDQRSEIIMMVIQFAREVQAFDYIEAWGGAIRYFSAWESRKQKVGGRGLPYICYWALDYPGVRQWSESVSARPRPWHGSYHYHCLPPGASLHSDGDFVSWLKAKAIPSA